MSDTEFVTIAVPPLDTGDMGPAPTLPPEALAVAAGRVWGGPPLNGAWVTVQEMGPFSSGPQANPFHHGGAPALYEPAEFFIVGSYIDESMAGQPIVLSVDQIRLIRVACNIAGHVASIGPLVHTALTRK